MLTIIEQIVYISKRNEKTVEKSRMPAGGVRKEERMKKKLCVMAAAVLLLCGVLTACGSKTETANDVDLTAFYNGLAEQYGWGDDMMDLDSDMLEMYYPGLGELSAKQLRAKSPVMSYAVNEYVFMQCGNKDDAAKAAEILQSRIDAQVGGDAFYPETIDQWKAAKVITNGTYVALIASGEHQAEIEDAWNGQFNG